MRTVRAFVLCFGIAGLALLGFSGLAGAATTPAPRPTASTEVVPESGGNDTLKLASLGVVFLIIGAAVVYAPQIVAAVGAIPRRLAGKPARSKPAPTKRAVPVPAPRVEDIHATSVIEVPRPGLPTVARAPAASIRVAEPDDVVSRLQSEVRSAWSRTR